MILAKIVVKSKMEAIFDLDNAYALSRLSPEIDNGGHFRSRTKFSPNDQEVVSRPSGRCRRPQNGFSSCPGRIVGRNELAK